MDAAGRKLLLFFLFVLGVSRILLSFSAPPRPAVGVGTVCLSRVRRAHRPLDKQVGRWECLGGTSRPLADGCFWHYPRPLAYFVPTGASPLLQTCFPPWPGRGSTPRRATLSLPRLPRGERAHAVLIDLKTCGRKPPKTKKTELMIMSTRAGGGETKKEAKRARGF